MPEYSFRLLEPSEEEAGYAIVNAAFGRAARRQPNGWQFPFPRANYAARQERGENHGLFRDGQLVSVLSLGQAAPGSWSEWRYAWHLRRLPPLRRLANRLGGRELRAPYAWLSSFGTGDVPSPGNLGRTCLAEAIATCRARGIEHIYLECVANGGVLPRYYSSFGFEHEATRRHRPTSFWLMHLDLT